MNPQMYSTRPSYYASAIPGDSCAINDEYDFIQSPEPRENPNPIHWVLLTYGLMIFGVILPCCGVDLGTDQMLRDHFGSHIVDLFVACILGGSMVAFYCKMQQAKQARRDFEHVPHKLIGRGLFL